MSKDTEYMLRALELAKEAAAAGEIPVGAVITDANGILGEGRNTREETGLATAHAEMAAVEAACRRRGDWRLGDCTLYVTLEPCPMCAGALASARIGRIVYGASDPAGGAAGGALDLTRQIPGWNPAVEGGLLSEECAALLAGFFGDLRKKKVSRRLCRDFFARPADTVARELLGKVLCVRSRSDGSVRRAAVTETEAYFGAEDSSSHAYRGQTDRNRPMFGKGGTVYVYLCYGMHHMLNIASGQKGTAEAVLLRGAEGLPGPGRLTAALGIDRGFNGSDAVLSDEIWFEDAGTEPPRVKASPRIGIGYAEERDREALLRFTIADN